MSMVLHIKNKHESNHHHVDCVGPEVMLVSLFHNCLAVINTYYKLVNRNVSHYN